MFGFLKRSNKNIQEKLDSLIAQGANGSYEFHDAGEKVIAYTVEHNFNLFKGNLAFLRGGDKIEDAGRGVLTVQQDIEFRQLVADWRMDKLNNEYRALTTTLQHNS